MRAYHVPPATIELGTVLEAAVRHGREVTVLTEWRGMRLLADFDAFDRVRPKIYLVRSARERLKTAPVSQGVLDLAADNYVRWGKREPDMLVGYTTHAAKYEHGRMLRLDYRSDKWHKKRQTVEYTHDFLELQGKAPKVFADTKALEKARTVVVFGGTMQISEDGIA